MANKILMPKLSPTMEEGLISRWLKAEGDEVEANETIAEVDTDKATMEMTSLEPGTLLKILVPAGDTTSLGSAIFAFLAAGTFKTVEEAQEAVRRTNEWVAGMAFGVPVEARPEFLEALVRAALGKLAHR